MADDIKIAEAGTLHPGSLREAYERVLPELAGVLDDELIKITIDVQTAVTMALGAWPEISALRERVVRELPELSLALFDKTKLYALAAGHAHSLYVASSSPVSVLPEQGEAIARMRENLLTAVKALAQRGLIDGDRLRELNGGNGYRNTAFDVNALVAMLRERWASVAGRTAITAEELDAAEKLGMEVITAVGERDRASATIAGAADRRQRAFTLFMRAYDHARRAISYLRWKERDVDYIAPSLYAGRGNRRRAPHSELSTPATAVTPAQGTPGVPALAPQSSIVPTLPGTLSSPIATNGHGVPGSNPFTA